MPITSAFLPMYHVACSVYIYIKGRFVVVFFKIYSQTILVLTQICNKSHQCCVDALHCVLLFYNTFLGLLSVKARDTTSSTHRPSRLHRSSLPHYEPHAGGPLASHSSLQQSYFQLSLRCPKSSSQTRQLIPGASRSCSCVLNGGSGLPFPSLPQLPLLYHPGQAFFPHTAARSSHHACQSRLLTKQTKEGNYRHDGEL